jgi:hypothetical protein
MNKMQFALLFVLFAFIFFAAQAESVYISVDQGTHIYTDGNETTISGTIYPDTNHWNDYRSRQFDLGTPYNVTINNMSINLEPGLDVLPLNGGTPVFIGASGSAWDSFLLQFDVVKVNGKYFMFYSGSNTSSSNGTAQIGVATSTDGLNWTRYTSNPLLKSGIDTYDFYGLSDPTVLVENGTWHMWYGGNRNGTSPDINICYATSTDGYSWSKHSGNPLMSNAGNNSAWNGTEIRPRSVLTNGNDYWIYYSANGTSNVTCLGLMTSSDGVNWTDSPSNPLYKGASGWEARNTRYGSVDVYNGTYRMWVYADGASGWKIGYITSYGGINWTNASLPLISPKVKSTYSKHLMEPTVVDEGGYYTLFFRGVNGTDVGAFHAFRVTPVKLNGTYTSDFKALGNGSVFYYFNWRALYGSWSTIDVEARYGNSTDSMSPWTEAWRYSPYVFIKCKYMQYRVEFSVDRDWLTGPRLNQIYGIYLSSVTSFVYSFDGGPFQNLTLADNNTWSINLSLEEGEQRLDLSAGDGTGDYHNTTCYIYADHSPPVGDIIIEWDNNSTAKTTVEVYLTVTDICQPVDTYLSHDPNLLSSIAFSMAYRRTLDWTFSGGTEGVVTLYVQYIDRFGRRSPIYNDSIIIDLSPPEGTFDIDGGAVYTNSTDVSLSVNWTDVAGVYLMWVSNEPDLSGGDSIRPFKNLPWKLPKGDGVKTVYVRLMDEVGWTTNLSATITLDSTPPTASLSIDGGAEYTSDLRVDLSFEIQDNASTEVMFKDPTEEWPDTWEALPSAWDLPWNLPEGEDGPRTVLMMVRDAAGNRLVVFDEILVDLTGPMGTVVINGGDQLTRSQDVTLTILAVDALSGLDAMRVSNTLNFHLSQWESPKSQMAWSLLIVDGEKHVFVRLRDNAGSTRIIKASIILDTHAPTGSIRLGDGGVYTMDPSVTIHLNIADPNGLSDMRASNSANMEMAEWVPYSTTMPWVLPNREGEHTVHVQVRDMAGNVQSADLVTFLDITDPVVTASIAEGDVVTLANYLEVVWTASDGNGLASVRYAYEPTFSGVGWDHPFSRGSKEHSGVEGMVLAAEGERRIYVQVIDMAGRVATASDSIWYVRDVPEGNMVLGDGSGWTGTPDLQVKAEWTGGSEATHYRVALVEDELEGAQWIAIDQTAMIELHRRAGHQTVYGQVKGRFDVMSELFSANITLDLSPAIVQVIKPTKKRTEAVQTALVVNVIEDLDPDPLVRWRVNEGPWRTYSGETRLDLEVGKNLIEVQCIDGAGNTGFILTKVVRDEPEGTSIGLVAVGLSAIALVVVVSLYWTLLRQKGKEDRQDEEE